jgi:uncharacterized protein
MAQSNGRGFAAMDPAEQRKIASKGGRAAHQSGHAHQWNSQEAAKAGHRGGLAAHQNRRAADKSPKPRQGLAVVESERSNPQSAGAEDKSVEVNGVAADVEERTGEARSPEVTHDEDVSAGEGHLDENVVRESDVSELSDAVDPEGGSAEQREGSPRGRASRGFPV